MRLIEFERLIKELRKKGADDNTIVLIENQYGDHNPLEKEDVSIEKYEKDKETYLIIKSF